MTPHRTDTGLSLLELTAALAIFALVAVMGLQALGMSMRLQRGLEARDAQTWELGRALALLRHDLDAAAPLGFAEPDGGIIPALRFAPRQRSFALSLSGQSVLPGTQETGFGRAEWRLDAFTGILYRRYWPTLSPFSDKSAGPEVKVLSDVQDLTIRALTDEGWQDSYGTGDAAPGSALPRAVEVLIVTAGHGDLRIVSAP